jgi:hypothetical protein
VPDCREVIVDEPRPPAVPLDAPRIDQPPEQPASTHVLGIGAHGPAFQLVPRLGVLALTLSVLELFRRMIGLPPTRRAKRELRQLFPCTGKITRKEFRQPEAMDAAFEAHAHEIFRQMEDDATLLAVLRILVTGSDRVSDRPILQWHAAHYLAYSGHEPAIMNQWISA